MRKIVFLISLVILVSCAKHSPTLNEKLIVDDTFSIKEYSTPTLVKEKFLEFYDLKLLLKNKPEFKKSIENRITSFKFDSTIVLNVNKDSKISNIHTTEIAIDKFNTNVYVKLIFDLEEKNKSVKDSIIGIVIKDSIIFNDQKISSSKIKFKRFDTFEFE